MPSAFPNTAGLGLAADASAHAARLPAVAPAGGGGACFAQLALGLGCSRVGDSRQR